LKQGDYVYSIDERSAGRIVRVKNSSPTEYLIKFNRGVRSGESLTYYDTGDGSLICDEVGQVIDILNQYE